MRSKSKRTYKKNKKKTKRKSLKFKRSNKRIKGGATVPGEHEEEPVLSTASQLARITDIIRSLIRQVDTVADQVATVHRNNEDIKIRLNEIDLVNNRITHILRQHTDVLNVQVQDSGDGTAPQASEEAFGIYS